MTDTYISIYGRRKRKRKSRSSVKARPRLFLFPPPLSPPHLTAILTEDVIHVIAAAAAAFIPPPRTRICGSDTGSFFLSLPFLSGRERRLLTRRAVLSRLLSHPLPVSGAPSSNPVPTATVTVGFGRHPFPSVQSLPFSSPLSPPLPQARQYVGLSLASRIGGNAIHVTGVGREERVDTRCGREH